MNTDFKELFEYFDQQFGELKERMGNLESGFRTLQVSVDNYAMKADNYYKEMAVLMHRVERLENIVKELAEKNGVKVTF